MALEILTASDLNGEFNNIILNALALISPLTGNLDVNFKQLTNMRFEVQTATQTAAQGAGRAYWQSSEGTIHVDTGTLIGRIPVITGIQAGDIIGMVNPTGVSGATTYGRLQLGPGLTVTGGTLNSTGAGAATILQTQVFS